MERTMEQMMEEKLKEKLKEDASQTAEITALRSEVEALRSELKQERTDRLKERRIAIAEAESWKEKHGVVRDELEKLQVRHIFAFVIPRGGEDRHDVCRDGRKDRRDRRDDSTAPSWSMRSLKRRCSCGGERGEMYEEESLAMLHKGWERGG